MKNNHTQLTRLAAISLVLVMCLSALPMLTPSASAAGEGTTYTWTAAGDGHYGGAVNPDGARQTALIDMVTAAGTQRHFDNGDLSDGGIAARYSSIKGIYDSGLGSVPYHISIGNHDDAASLMSTFDVPQHYTVVDGDYVWIVLDSSKMSDRMTPYGLYYLEDQLERYCDKLVFIVAHMPQKIVQPAVSPSSVDNAHFIKLVEAHAAHIGAVVFSHTHYSDYQLINGVHYVNTGSYGKMTPGMFVRFDIDSDGREHTITVRDYNMGHTDGRHYLVPPTTYTVTVPNVTPPSEITRPTFVWDGEGDDDLASNPLNWYRDVGGVITNDVAPTSEGHVIFDATSTKDCTWDLDAADCTPYSITIATGYTGTVTQAATAEIGIGEGGYLQQAGTMRQNALVSVAGNTLLPGGLLVGDTTHDWVSAGDFITDGTTVAHTKNTLNLVMTGTDSLLWLGQKDHLNSLNIMGQTIKTGSVWGDKPFVSHLNVSGKLTIEEPFHVRCYNGGTYHNEGVIDGPKPLRFALSTSDGNLPDLGMISCPVWIVTTSDSGYNNRMTATTNIVVDELYIIALHRTLGSITLDLDGYDLTATTVTLGARGSILGGEGTITTSAWDSTAGTWTPEESTVVLRDGGTVKLAPGQSFNRLEIASDDGRTASWNMTATGTVSPIVTGLRSGSYLWYLDGVEQGEIRADKDGTIALSYQSTGLHTLSVGPTPRTEAMDGVYQAVGIVAVLAVLGGLITMVGRLKF